MRGLSDQRHGQAHVDPSPRAVGRDWLATDEAQLRELIAKTPDLLPGVDEGPPVVVMRELRLPAPLASQREAFEMAHRTDTFDIGRLGLSSGEARRLDLEVTVDPLELGGQRYQAEGGVLDAGLDVSHTVAGYSLRLRYATRLQGPCVRCLEDAQERIEIDTREVDQPRGGEELSSPYLEGGHLELKAWARDALVLALPIQIACREDCLGLCAVCGENLNEAAADHAHERAPDPRWAKLSELKLEER